MTKKFRNFSSGFTLIEILVVIAIIGILSSVVLASLNTARRKAGNTAVKANLANARVQGEFFYDTNTSTLNGYNGVCTDTFSAGGIESARRAIDAAHSASGATGSVIISTPTAQVLSTTNCHNNAAGWAVSVPLKAPEVVGGATYLYWCTDSRGFFGGRASPLAGNATVCPSS